MKKLNNVLEVVEKLNEFSSGHSGECGIFAIALFEIIQDGSFYALYDPKDLNNYLHVVLKVGDSFYDFEGKTSLNRIKENLEKNTEDSFEQIDTYIFEPVSINEILDKTNKTKEDLNKLISEFEEFYLY